MPIVGARPTLGQARVDRVRERGVHDVGVDTGHLDRLHQLRGERQVHGRPGPDGAFVPVQLGVDLGGKLVDHPPGLQRRAVQDDSRIGLPQQLSGLFDVQGVHRIELYPRVQPHVRGALDGAVGLPQAPVGVRICRDDVTDVGNPAQILQDDSPQFPDTEEHDLFPFPHLDFLLDHSILLTATEQRPLRRPIPVASAVVSGPSAGCR
jgi:hypothetical protein